MRSALPALILLALPMEAMFIALHLLGDLRREIVEAMVLYVTVSLFYILASYLVCRDSETAAKLDSRKTLLVLLGVALVFRLTVWPLAPALSDDVYRYRWEGMLQAQGGNPYQARPTDPEWAELRDATYPRIVGKDFKAGYGPLIELIEHGAYRVISGFTADPWKQAFWFKAPFALFDAATILALILWLKVRGQPVRRVLIYAWSPLGVMEFWAGGHNDSVAVCCVVVALLLAEKRHWWSTFLALSLAAAAKIWPLLLFPLFIGWNGRRPLRWKEWLVLLPVAGVLAAPYWSDVMENARFMSGFVGGWRNNDTIFGLLLWLTGDLYQAKYAAFGLIAVVVLGVTLARLPLERAALVTIAATLFISANSHTWYLAWMLPLLCVVPSAAVFLWTALMPLSYVVVIDWQLLGEWRGSTWVRWYIYGPVYGMLAVSAWLNRWRAKSGAQSD